MNAVDSARRQLQSAATEWVRHIERGNCGPSCSHTQAKRYAEAREKCAQLEREQLAKWTGQIEESPEAALERSMHGFSLEDMFANVNVCIEHGRFDIKLAECPACLTLRLNARRRQISG